jgi:hypothetical protein
MHVPNQDSKTIDNMGSSHWLSVVGHSVLLVEHNNTHLCVNHIQCPVIVEGRQMKTYKTDYSFSSS